MLSYFGNCNSPWESLILFEAAKEGLLPTIMNRLTEDERKEIASGAIFIWDERRSSIRRWTDGITWSNSRVIGDFLEYRELLPDVKSDERQCRFTVKAYGLCKRTLCLASSDDPDDFKLRLVSYCSKRDAALGRLPLPSADPKFNGIVRRLEAKYGFQSSSPHNGFQRLSGVFKRNPSPRRDRRKSRREKSSPPADSFNPFVTPSGQSYGSRSEQEHDISQSTLGHSEAALPQSSQPCSEVVPHLQQSQIEPSPPYQRHHSEVSPHCTDDSESMQNSNTSTNVITKLIEERSHTQACNSSVINAPPAQRDLTTSASGREQVLFNLLRLDSVCDGDRNNLSLILPEPLKQNRLDRRNSEDLRLLNMLDNCVNAFY